MELKWDYHRWCFPLYGSYRHKLKVTISNLVPLIKWQRRTDWTTEITIQVKFLTIVCIVPVVPTLPKGTLLCYKWERKRYEMNEIVWYDARLMAQCFSQNALWLMATLRNVVSVSPWGYRYGDLHVSSRIITYTGSNSSKPQNTLLTRFEAFTCGLKNPTYVVYPFTWLFDQSGIWMNALVC